MKLDINRQLGFQLLFCFFCFTLLKCELMGRLILKINVKYST